MVDATLVLWSYVRGVKLLLKFEKVVDVKRALAVNGGSDSHELNGGEVGPKQEKKVEMQMI